MLRSLHLELTTRCSLSCPACPRTWFSDTLHRPVPKQDIDRRVLWDFLSCDTAQTIDTFRIEGNHGDAIYWPEFLDFLREWRHSKRFHIVTNGSRQRPEFWTELRDLLTEQDRITFSIDGLEDTNHLYRRNSDWASIMQAISIISQGTAQLNWKTIVFSHNQHQLAEIEALARGSGADQFELVKSHRFGRDELRPDLQYIDTSRLYQTSKSVTHIDPVCSDHKECYISADGYLWPCCMISSYFTLHKTVLWQQRRDWSIDKNTLDTILQRMQDWGSLVGADPLGAPDVCKMMCGR